MKIIRIYLASLLAAWTSSALGAETSKAAEDTGRNQTSLRQAFELTRSNALLGMKYFEAIRTTNTFSGMSTLALSCRQIPGIATNELFLAEVVSAIYFRSPAPFVATERIQVPSRVSSGKMKPIDNAPVIRQDVFVQSGRAAWFLEQLLNCELPEISERSTEDEIRDAATEAHYCVREALLPPDAPRTVAGLTGDERRKLAEAPDSNAVIFYKLSKDPDKAIRSAVAANKNAPGHVLSKLARDKDPEVKRLALENLKLVRSFSE